MLEQSNVDKGRRRTHYFRNGLLQFKLLLTYVKYKMENKNTFFPFYDSSQAVVKFDAVLQEVFIFTCKTVISVIK
jgi:hypothetical protein